MPSISKEKIKKIKENIIFFLFNSFPKALFTSEIASEIARDEEFTKKILLDLEKEKIIIKITNNSQGKHYIKRVRWSIPKNVYENYKKITHNVKTIFENK